MTEVATRKVLMSPEFMEQWATRDERGNLLRWEWRQPDAEGWWEPTISTVYTDNLVADALTALKAEVEGLLTIEAPSDLSEYSFGLREGYDQSRAAVLAAIDGAMPK